MIVPRTLAVAKGHGTENDFVILTDPEDFLDPPADLVRYLCRRQAGLGADGLLRVVKAGHIADWAGDPGLWFMDYRNADGTVAEMCGNGLRVFVMHLVEKGLVDPKGPIYIATRAGVRVAEVLPGGRVRVEIGPAVVSGERYWIEMGGIGWKAIPVDVGNPHGVCFHDDVDAVDFSGGPEFSRDQFTRGVNVEVVQVLGPGHLKMRVHERGVGETRSCGTGTVAVAAAAAATLPEEAERTAWRVDVPGGTLRVDLGENCMLTGPAVIVFEGEARIRG